MSEFNWGAHPDAPKAAASPAGNFNWDAHPDIPAQPGPQSIGNPSGQPGGLWDTEGPIASIAPTPKGPISAAANFGLKQLQGVDNLLAKGIKEVPQIPGQIISAVTPDVVKKGIGNAIDWGKDEVSKLTPQFIKDRQAEAEKQKADLLANTPPWDGKSTMTPDQETVYRISHPPATGMDDPALQIMGMMSPESGVNLIKSMGSLAKQGVEGVTKPLSEFLRPAVDRANLLDMFKKQLGEVQPTVANKLNEAKEIFDAKNITLPYKTSQAMANNRMSVVNLDNFKGVDPSGALDAKIAEIEAAQKAGANAQTQYQPTQFQNVRQVTESTPIKVTTTPETNLSPNPTVRVPPQTDPMYPPNVTSYEKVGIPDEPSFVWKNMEGGKQKFATPTIPSKFGNSLADKLKAAIQNPELNPSTQTIAHLEKTVNVPSGPVQTKPFTQVAPDPAAVAADFPAHNIDPTNPLSSNSPDPRALFGLKPGESYVPASDVLELRKLANKASRFTEPSPMNKQSAQELAQNEKAVAAGNHARAALADTDPALADISDKLESAYALRDNALKGSDKNPITPIVGTNMDKAQRLEQFDAAAGFDPKGGLRQLGKDVDLANVRAGNSRAAEMFGTTALTTQRGLARAILDRFPRAYDAAAQNIYQGLNPAATPLSQQLSKGYYMMKALPPYNNNENQ